MNAQRKLYNIRDFRPAMRLVDERLTTMKAARYEILEDCDIATSTGVYSIPRGFVTDGASVWWIARPAFPVLSMYFGATTIHDMLCKDAELLKEFKIRSEADRNFYPHLIECGTNAIRARIMSEAVILAGEWENFRGKYR